MRALLQQAQISDQVSAEERNSQPIDLIPILIAQQFVLIPLYFLLPIWIFIFNSGILFFVYFSKVQHKFKVVKGLKVILVLIAVAGIFFLFIV